jgi:hypothetical protein
MCPQLSLGERRSRGTEAAAQLCGDAHRSKFVAAVRSGQLTAVEGV